MGKIRDQISQIQSTKCDTCGSSAHAQCRTPGGKPLDVPHITRVNKTRPE